MHAGRCRRGCLSRRSVVSRGLRGADDGRRRRTAACAGGRAAGVTRFVPRHHRAEEMKSVKVAVEEGRRVSSEMRSEKSLGERNGLAKQQVSSCLDMIITA